MTSRLGRKTCRLTLRYTPAWGVLTSLNQSGISSMLSRQPTAVSIVSQRFDSVGMLAFCGLHGVVIVQKNTRPIPSATCRLGQTSEFSNFQYLVPQFALWLLWLILGF